MHYAAAAEEYAGDWVEGEPVGSGKLTLLNSGDVLEGVFRRGQPAGFGRLVTPQVQCSNTLQV